MIMMDLNFNLLYTSITLSLTLLFGKCTNQVKQPLKKSTNVVNNFRSSNISYSFNEKKDRDREHKDFKKIKGGRKQW